MTTGPRPNRSAFDVTVTFKHTLYANDAAEAERLCKSWHDLRCAGLEVINMVTKVKETVDVKATRV